LEDGTLLRDAIAADPSAWLGEAHLDRFGLTTGLLVKLLDAAERLPVHAHPNRAFAAAHFDSLFGKTEAWIVVDTRGESAEIWVGLTEPADRQTYRAWIDAQDRDALLNSLNRVEVRAGDVVYVPAGIPHAIGAGVLIAELQEPTDFSLLCEYEGFPVDPADSHLGLGWDRALDAFELGAHEPVRHLPDEAKAYFWADEVVEPAGRFAVLLVLEGQGSIDGKSARAGDRFAVPAMTEELSAEGPLRVLRCLAPEPA
jgi:mannose-6-phosphate isomerase